MNIHDIAAMCGVSAATVSRVINNSPNVSPPTRELVLRTMQEAEYIPNAFASGFGRNSMQLAGILCRDVANMYYANVVSLLERELRGKGFDSLLCCTGRNLTDIKERLTSVLQKRVNAVILVGSAYREERDNSHIREAAAQAPVFMVNAFIQTPNVYCVYCDERDAMKNAVKRLFEDGRRKILYIHDMAKWAWSGSQKLAGVRDGLTECGLTPGDDLIQQVTNGIDPARRRVSDLIERGVDFDAALASEDLLAIGAQKALLAAGKDIPVVGFNNSQLAECATPELSSVDNMLETICVMSVDFMASLLAGNKIPQKVVVSAELVQRKTFRA
ncbi:MAG: LacI family transcriptional regulator [Clostridiales bacterium]|nr:LacI family transcriptional regulator [Clostridiales bacterium]